MRNDDAWCLDGLEDLPSPRWDDDELDEAYEHLWGSEEKRAAWSVFTCTDGMGHVFESRHHSAFVMNELFPRPICGRPTHPLGGIMPTAFCSDCMARKAPN